MLALLFGAGLTTTLTIWGVVVAGLGGLLGLRELARQLSLAGGAVAYVLGLWTLRLVRLPSLPSGTVTLPVWLARRSALLGAFALGLLLGNMGLCCPDPVFLSLIPFIAGARDPGDGALLAAAYGLGRATPLVALVAVASSGADALQLATHHKQRFDRALGWGLIAVGTVIIFGYSNLSDPRPLALLMISCPVLVDHRKKGSAWSRIALWLAATSAATLLGLELVYLFLVNLP